MPIRIGQAPDHGFDEPLGLLSDCHRRIEHFLHVLTAITDQRNGGELDAVQRRQLEGALTYFATAAPRHTADEEESLFPRLRASADQAVHDALQLVDRLERDHEEANAHHAAVDRLARQWLDANRLAHDEARALANHLRALDTLYRGHIAVEDQQLFPAAARALTARDLGDIGREMESRRR